MVWHPYILLPIYPLSCSKLLALNTPTVFDVHQFHVVLHVTCVFVMCYRYWVNSEQCAVYQQQCCDHHGYWNW